MAANDSEGTPVWHLCRRIHLTRDMPFSERSDSLHGQTEGPMYKIRDVLRLFHDAALSERATGRSLGMSRSGVSKIHRSVSSGRHPLAASRPPG